MLALVAVSVLGAGIWFYRRQEQLMRRDVEASLAAIAQLKVEQIVAWRTERLGDARVIMGGDFLAGVVARWLAQPDDKLETQIRDQFRSVAAHNQYSDVLLVDRTGTIRLRAPESSVVLHTESRQGLAAVWQSRQPVVIDLHESPGEQFAHIGVIAPLSAGDGPTNEPLAAIILRFEGRRFLFPLIQHWPTASPSAETLLVRREGDSVLFLNDLRHQTNTALKLRFPLSRTDSPAGQAALGREGVCYGTDYRGVKVLAVLKQVPDSPWAMVAKIDEAEVLADWRARTANLIVSFILILLLGTGATAAVIWHEQNRTRELAQSTAALRVEKANLDAIFKSSPTALFILDETTNIVRVNAAAVALSGGSAADILQRRPGAAWHCAHSAEDPRGCGYASDCPLCPLRNSIEALIRNGGEMHGSELMLEVIRNGAPQTIWVVIGAEAVQLNGRRHLCVALEEITARKQAEAELQASHQQLSTALAELKQTQQQIVQQASLRALGQMASGMAHDFNNALSPIVGFSELLLKDPEKLADREQSLRFLQIIHTAGRDAADIVRRLREFGRKRVAGEISEAIDLAGIVGQIIELTQPRWKDQAQAAGCTIQMVTNLHKVPPIAGEESAIREVLTNLVFNAVDALPAGGTITLGTAVDGGFVRVWVSDTGTGMSAEVQRHCLEPFYTTKGEKGTGLGLAMVQGIVQRHRGTVAIVSAPGQGTTVTLRLPLTCPKSGSLSSDSAAPLTQSLRMLVVDDERLLQVVVGAYLTSDGHRVTTASSGAFALPLVEEGQFDLVITDQAMPQMNGEQLAVAIHALKPALPIILMSGFGDLMKAEGKLPAHIRAILSKPITEDSLRAALAKVFPVA